MDFGKLPPEVNSAKMYAGPGAGSMLGAAAAWDALADELYTTAGLCRLTISVLTGGTTLSVGAASMAAATALQLAWMDAIAARARQTATQIRSAAIAFETALSATVPPSVIAANRALLMWLTATNILGINTSAVAITEAHYSEMWAQDGEAMYGYAGAAAVVLAGPAAAATRAVNTTAGARVQAALTQVTSVVPQALQQLAQPLPPTSG